MIVHGIPSSAYVVLKKLTTVFCKFMGTYYQIPRARQSHLKIYAFINSQNLFVTVNLVLAWR